MSSSSGIRILILTVLLHFAHIEILGQVNLVLIRPPVLKLLILYRSALRQLWRRIGSDNSVLYDFDCLVHGVGYYYGKVGARKPSTLLIASSIIFASSSQFSSIPENENWIEIDLTQLTFAGMPSLQSFLFNNPLIIL